MASILVKFVASWALFCGVVLGEREWCDLKCTKNYGYYRYSVQENTMCKYEEKTTTVRGTPVVNVMTPKMKEDLLKMHNEFRNKIASGGLEGWPTAADMLELSWDDDLAKSAQRWASQCQNDHDECRKTPNFESVGQNLALEWTTGRFEKIDVSIAGWTGEAKLAPRFLVDYYQSIDNTGHFTQVSWAKTQKIGCGVVVYEKNDWNTKLLACNYGPAGNVITQRMYTRGAPCSACPEGTRCNPESNTPYLCA
uniref:SCP domain-containing protein n=1 Tax=Lygus hesperus TaxID=30085 RepID=A0A0K8SY92_LYGHE